jgi:hypothetical protein
MARGSLESLRRKNIENRVVFSQGVDTSGIGRKLAAKPFGINPMAPGSGYLPSPDKGLRVPGIKAGRTVLLETVQSVRPGVGLDVPVGKVHTGKEDTALCTAEGQIQGCGGNGPPLRKDQSGNTQIFQRRLLPEAPVAQGEDGESAALTGESGGEGGRKEKGTA